jgi:hypothetical protein
MSAVPAPLRPCPKLNLILAVPMVARQVKAGRPITPEQFDDLSDEQLARLVPKA